MLEYESSTFLLQMILKQKLRGQGMAFLVGGGSGTICFVLVSHPEKDIFENMMLFCSLAVQIGQM
uniref:Uncharacterized protein n=1 Tax=Arundo donax TaxID=35708 RepID=A0A0A9CW87_ARUDO